MQGWECYIGYEYYIGVGLWKRFHSLAVQFGGGTCTVDSVWVKCMATRHTSTGQLSPTIETALQLLLHNISGVVCACLSQPTVSSLLSWMPESFPSKEKSVLFSPSYHHFSVCVWSHGQQGKRLCPVEKIPPSEFGKVMQLVVVTSCYYGDCCNHLLLLRGFSRGGGGGGGGGGIS